MMLSIITVRRNRPEYTQAELESICQQTFPRNEYEIIMLDDSTTTALPQVVTRYQRRLPIRFVHFHGWQCSPTLHVGSNGRRSMTFHLNYGLQMARGDITLLALGEFLHIGSTLHEMTAVHDKHHALIYHGCVRDLKRTVLDHQTWRQDTSCFLDDEIVWGQWVVHPQHTPLHDEFVFSSVKTTHLRWVGGFDECFLSGLECELGESYRRLVRAGCEVQYSSDVVAAHIEHDRAGRDLELPNYLAAQRARRLFDQGYWEQSPKVKYYRPGTEKRPVRANRDRLWGMLPCGVETWTLEETVQRLPQIEP